LVHPQITQIPQMEEVLEGNDELVVSRLPAVLAPRRGRQGEGCLAMQPFVFQRTIRVHLRIIGSCRSRIPAGEMAHHE
jgi:hypothetical protein